MATTMEQRAKFRDLRTSGISREEAQTQAYGNIAPATATPIAPVAPTPVTPAPMVNAPVDPTTGLSAPLAPVVQAIQPAQAIQSEQDINKQYGGTIQSNGINSVQPLNAEASIPAEKPVVASKVEAPIDYNQSNGREAEIGANLDAFKAKGMTPEQIMQASGYATATPEKKALIEPYLKQQVPTASAMYNNIVAKADIPDEQKTSLPYKIASNRYAKANMFSGMTASQLANEMKNVKLVEGSQAYEDLKAMNPKLVLDTENLRKVNGTESNIWTYTNNSDGTSTKINNLENTYKNDFLDNFAEEIKKMYAIQTPEQIRAIIRTPDVVSAEDKAFEFEGKINEIDKQIEASDAEVEARLAGSGASGNRIALEKSSARDRFNKDRDSLAREYTRYANKANSLTTQNMTMYTTQQQQKQAQNAAMLPFLNDQYKTEQEKIKAEQALKDPATAIKTVMDEYKKLGIPFTSTVQSRLAEFKASGKPLEQFLTEMGQNIQKSPAYQKYQELQSGAMSDTAKLKAQQDFELKKIGMEKKGTAPEFKVIGKNADGTDKYGWVNATNQTVTPYGEVATTTIPSGKSLFDVLGKNVGTYAGNRGYDLAGALGDPLPAGGNWTVKSVGEAGETKNSIYIDGKSTKPYGNTVVMTDDQGNEIRYSHLQNVGVKAGDVLGFGDIVGTRGNTGNVKGANGETLTAEQLKSGRGAHLDVEIKSGGKLLSNADQVTFLKGLKDPRSEYSDQNINDLAYLTELQEKNPTQAAKDMKELGYNARDVANYKAGNVPLTEKQKNSSTDIMDSIKNLSDPSKYEWNDAVGFQSMFPTAGGTDAANAEQAINSLVAKLTLPNLGVLKGPMSDKDIAFIKDASANLSIRQSDDTFERSLVDAYNLAARRAGKQQIEKLSDISRSTQKSTVGGELNYSKYEPK